MSFSIARAFHVERFPLYSGNTSIANRRGTSMMTGNETSGDCRFMPNPDELYAEASKLKNTGKLPEAVAQLEEILKIAPDHVLTHSALGVLLQKLGRPDDAIAHARRVTELEPKDPFSFTQLSVICQRCGRIQEAEDAMAQAHDLQGRAH